MKIITWNVNGIRAAYKKGLYDLLEKEQPDYFCLQETKAHPEQLEPEILNPNGYSAYWSAAQRRGYSGVATFAKKLREKVDFGIGVAEFDLEGRFVISETEHFTLFNIYFPNGSNGPERHSYKMRFLATLNSTLKARLARGENVIVVGDYNVAYLDLDVHDPVGLTRTSGFLPEERQWFHDFLALGFVDTFRYLNPKTEGAFTWWSYFDGARDLNEGWRIDHICVSDALKSRIRRVEILHSQMGSDHCPVLLELE